VRKEWPAEVLLTKSGQNRIVAKAQTCLIRNKVCPEKRCLGAGLLGGTSREIRAPAVGEKR
jgi:hypothetical protein